MEALYFFLPALFLPLPPRRIFSGTYCKSSDSINTCCRCHGMLAHEVESGHSNPALQWSRPYLPELANNPTLTWGNRKYCCRWRIDDIVISVWPVRMPFQCCAHRWHIITRPSGPRPNLPRTYQSTCDSPVSARVLVNYPGAAPGLQRHMRVCNILTVATLSTCPIIIETRFNEEVISIHSKS